MIKSWYTKRNSPDSLSTDSLIKKLDDEDLTRIANYGIKSHYSQTIKPEVNLPKHEGFNKIVSSPEIHKRDMEYDDSGYEPKLIYHTPEETFMVKPYHNMKGTGGLAAKTMHRMFNDAGMGDKVEDLRVHHIMVGGQNVPVTVHKFENNTLTADQVHPSKVDGLDINKINVLDFLHGNYDRHQANLLFRHHEGSYQPVAIDHGLGLDYTNKKFPDNPYILNYHIVELGRDPARQKKLALWWKAHANNVRSGFIDEMNSLKHEPTRNNILKHFKDRHAKMTEWADKILSGQEAHLDDVQSDYKNASNLLGTDDHDPPAKLKKIVEGLSKPSTYTLHDIIDAVRDINGHIPHNDFMNALDTIPHTEEGHVAKHELINSLMRNIGWKGAFELSDDKKKLRDILVNDHYLPEGSRHVNPLMADKIRRFLGDKT